MQCNVDPHDKYNISAVYLQAFLNGREISDSQKLSRRNQTQTTLFSTMTKGKKNKTVEYCYLDQHNLSFFSNHCNSTMTRKIWAHTSAQTHPTFPKRRP